MNIQEIWRYFVEGKKVRRSSWPANEYIVRGVLKTWERNINTEHSYSVDLITVGKNYYSVTISDEEMIADDWVLYEEPRYFAIGDIVTIGSNLKLGIITLIGTNRIVLITENGNRWIEPIIINDLSVNEIEEKDVRRAMGHRKEGKLEKVGTIKELMGKL